MDLKSRGCVNLRNHLTQLSLSLQYWARYTYSVSHTILCGFLMTPDGAFALCLKTKNKIIFVNHK